MKKKLLVLLIVAIPTLMPNLVSAVAIDVEDGCKRSPPPPPSQWCGCASNCASP